VSVGRIDNSTRACGKGRRSPGTQPYVQAVDSKGDDGGGSRAHADHCGDWDAGGVMMRVSARRERERERDEEKE
jgi:hypothetical protein